MDFTVLDLPPYLPDDGILESFNYAKEEVSAVFLERINASPQSFGHFMDSLAEHQVEVDELNALLYRLSNQSDGSLMWLELRDWLRNHAVRHSELLAVFNLKHPNFTD